MTDAPRPRRTWRSSATIAVVVAVFCTAGIAALVIAPSDSSLRRLGSRLKIRTYHQFVVLSERLRGPNVEWETATPMSAGLNRERLSDLRDALEARGTTAFLLVKDNRIIDEWYRPGRGSNSRFGVASAAKALVGSLVLGVALDTNALQPDAPASIYIDQWAHDPVRSGISIMELATHTAGIEDVYFGGGTEPDSGWQGVYYRNPQQRFSIALTAPVLFTPGSAVRYSGVGYYALAYASAVALERAELPDMRTLLRNRVMAPLEVGGSDWNISYGDQYQVDGMDLYAIGSGAEFTARAAARIGQLMLDEGRWQNEQVLRPEVVRLLTTAAEVPTPDRTSGEPEPIPAIGWWANADTVWRSVPADAFVAAGANHQIVLVIPSLEVVVVRFGSALGGTHWGPGFWAEFEEHLLKPLMGALTPSVPVAAVR